MDYLGRDIRHTGVFHAAEALYNALLEPGTGFVYDATGLDVSPDGSAAVFTGLVQPDLYSAPASSVYRLELAGGEISRISPGPHDRAPHYSPGGDRLAYLTDPEGTGRFVLRLLDPDAEVTTDGTIEYFSWAPAGDRILMGVAGLGADLAGAQGGTAIAAAGSDLPQWVPTVETGDAEDLWRRAWVYDPASGTARVVSPPGLNVWESVWMGSDRILAVVSDDHSEGAWYGARLVSLDVRTGSVETVFRPSEQIGWPAVSPSGTIAVVEAICSDRWIVAGEVTVLGPDGEAMGVDTGRVDVTWLHWLDGRRLAYAGHRDLETVVGWVDIEAGSRTEVWASEERTFGEWYPQAAPHAGEFFVVGEAYAVAPEIARIDAAGYRPIHSFAPSCLADPGFVHGRVEPIAWTAVDGLELQGRLVRATDPEPHPVIMDIHGGPIWCHRDRWLGRQRGAELFTRAGYSVFYPNPRGSSGRGQAFAAMVRGDMGGADTFDYLSGLDALVERGIADPARLGVTGISYGGFMSAWLISQDPRFRAAVVISPVTNWYSQHRTSQIPFFDELFLEKGSSAPGGLFFERSPAFFAERVSCATLVLAGDLDKNTPPTQALEFYRSLLEHGVETALVRYPDVSARALDWFVRLLGG